MTDGHTSVRTISRLLSKNLFLALSTPIARALDTSRLLTLGSEHRLPEASRERGRSLEGHVLDLLQGEFAGVIRSHTRGEDYEGR